MIATAPAAVPPIARTPVAPLPVTNPVAWTETAPVPLLSTRMPVALPVTAAAVTVREPADVASASIPIPPVPIPVTRLVAEMLSAFALACLATIPVGPVADATLTEMLPAVLAPIA